MNQEEAVAEYRSATVSGVGPDAPTVQNVAGGKQSDSGRRMDLVPATAILAVSKVLDCEGGKYGPTNWRLIKTESHLNHALVHIFAYLAGDAQDDHLEHAACRALMALEQKLGGKSLQQIVEGLTERVAKQSDQLSRNAERRGA